MANTIHDRRSGSNAQPLLRPRMRLQDSPAVDSPSRSRFRHPVIHGFLPLPPISASPICTPTSTSSRELSGPFDESSLLSAASDEYTTAPTTPSSLSDPPYSLPPTWISTPPTPPPKLFRRSVTCVARRPLTPSVTPSESFPASLSAKNSASHPKRRASVPNMSIRAHNTRYKTDAILAASPLRSTFLTSNSRQKPPVFDISHQVSSDTEDSGLSESPNRSQDGSFESNPSTSDQNNSDNLRRYHALAELLATEVSYLNDLRVLVLVYLCNLHSLESRTPLSSSFTRSASFSSISRATALSHLQMTSISDGKERERSSSRSLLTSGEIDLLTRNADQLLDFHTKFVEELARVLSPLGFELEADMSSAIHASAMENLDAAISITSTKFATEASRFGSYEAFCSRHSEVVNTVRKVSQQYPSEWESYELSCACQALMSPERAEWQRTNSSSPLSSRSQSQEVITTKSGTLVVKDRKRTPSLSSIDSFRKRHRVKKDLSLDLKSDKLARSLTLLDYLIKPIQRICKYPLLLDQLVIKNAQYPKPNVNVVVESAALAMRHVASLVDDAKHKEELSLQSSLIVIRMSDALPSLSSSMISSARAPFNSLTSSFLSSLGTCLLGGPLDVIHHHTLEPAPSPVLAKYLGCFLYMGGYLILVKVKGKTYEPRHWFRLTDFEFDDWAEHQAMLPFSFSLMCTGHHFEFAASCQKEKAAWVSAIRISLSQTNVSWINEPVPSLHVDTKGEVVPSALDNPFEVINSLPTIHSIPDLMHASDSSQILLETVAGSSASSKHDGTPRAEASRSSSRRSSVSVRGIFSSNSQSDTILIRRSTASSRSQVDLGLEDVISESCATARSYATSHEHTLFQASQLSKSKSTVRSSKGLRVTIRKHESLRVPRRTRNSIFGEYELPPGIRTSGDNQTLRERGNQKPLSARSTGSDADSLVSFPQDRPRTSEASSLASSQPTSPAENSTFSFEERSTDGSRSRSTSHSRPNSLYNNMRGLFLSRSSSPDSEPPRSFLKRWTARHRHTKSAPAQADASPLSQKNYDQSW